MSTLNSAITASASALHTERVRIETAVSNIANAETTRGEDGQPYRRRDVMIASDPVNPFDTMLGTASATGVKISGIVEDQKPFGRRYEPSHPDMAALLWSNRPVPDHVRHLTAVREFLESELSALGARAA